LVTYGKTKETGFLWVSASCNEVFWQNPVSDYPCVKEYSPGRTKTKETGFLCVSACCNEVFSQKPGFWPPVRRATYSPNKRAEN